MMYVDNEPMEEDLYADPQDSQQPTQSTQSQPSQEETERPWDGHLWGYIVPCRDRFAREDFWKINPTIRIGRSNENDIVLNSLRISNKHCEIEWDGKTENSIVKVIDMSSNGTFINGIKIGKGRVAILKDGNEIGFGTWGSVNALEDYRYIFRFNASGPPNTGVYAHYDIGHELGKGSFATVMCAVEKATGDTYAVKIIHRNKFKAKNQDTLKLFIREISILEGLKHPNICNLHETFIDETIHLVLEYVEGGDLLDYIVKYGGVSDDLGRHLTRQLCDALKYIHSKGIAHRDLKPENVLLSKDNPPILKVADFGLAKAVDSMTKFKTTCGTPCYLAPEVILRENAEEGYDERVDSWSVGVIVFSMLSNASPFIEANTEDIRERFKSRYINWPILDCSYVSPVAKNFIAHLLEVNPRVRMSCGAALEHPWLAFPPGEGLAHFVDDLSYADQDYHHGNDGTVVSMLDASNANGHLFRGASAPALYSTPTPGGYVRVELADGSSGDSESSMNSQLATPIPGDFPLSQGAGPPGQRQPIVRRAEGLKELDPEGKLQQFELIAPSERKNNTNPNGHGNRKQDNAKKRKEVPDGMVDGYDSPLTPGSDDTADGNVMQNEISPGRAKRGGYALRNVKQRGDVPVVKAPVSKGRRK